MVDSCGGWWRCEWDCELKGSRVKRVMVAAVAVVVAVVVWFWHEMFFFASGAIGGR